MNSNVNQSKLPHRLEQDPIIRRYQEKKAEGMEMKPEMEIYIANLPRPAEDQHEMDQKKIKELEAELEEAQKERRAIKKKYDHDVIGSRKRRYYEGLKEKEMEEEAAELKKRVQYLEDEERKDEKIKKERLEENRSMKGQAARRLAKIVNYQRKFVAAGLHKSN